MYKLRELTIDSPTFKYHESDNMKKKEKKKKWELTINSPTFKYHESDNMKKKKKIEIKQMWKSE